MDYHFTEHLKNLTPWNNQENPWFNEFWEYSFNCTLAPPGGQDGQKQNKQPCDRRSTISDIAGYYNDSWVNSFIDAVYIAAHGINDTVQYCRGEYG